MRLIMVGVNHRTAGVELREKLALTPQAMDQALARFRALYAQTEAVGVSTCNRTEIYLATATGPAGEPTISQIHAFLGEFSGVPGAALTSALISHENQDAVTHLFRVCSGLDSMVLGETQILGQVRRSYEGCAARGTVGPVLHRLFQQALAVGKQVRRETAIDSGRMSMGSIAVDFARQVFDRFDDKIVLGIGAGEMAKLTLRHLCDLRPKKLWLTNRTETRAQALAEKLAIAGPAGGTRPFEQLDDLLVEADIVLTSTAAPTPIITVQRVKPLLKRRRYRPLIMIDIAMPRDIEPGVAELDNVYVYNIDDLQRVADQTRRERSAQVDAAETLLTAAARACVAELEHRDLGLIIRALRQRLHELGAAEQARTVRRLAALPAEQFATVAPELIEEHTQRLINKILHLPLSQLERGREDGSSGAHAAALERLFDLEASVPKDSGAGDGHSAAADATPSDAAAERKT